MPEKGAHLAIQAARAAGLELDLVGPVADPGYFEDHIRPHLGSSIRYLGHLDHAALAARVGAATVTLVTPRWDEPYGLVVAESLACGTPVAAFDRGGLSQVVSPQGGVLAAPGDTAALAEAVVTAARLDRGDVRAYAESTCSADAMVESYLDLYAELTRQDDAA